MSSAREIHDTISLITWRDPRTDPAPADTSYILVVRADGSVIVTRQFKTMPDDIAWAELPTPSEATLDDLRFALGAVEGGIRSDPVLPFEAEAPHIADRLRALLPEGEK